MKKRMSSVLLEVQQIVAEEKSGKKKDKIVLHPSVDLPLDPNSQVSAGAGGPDTSQSRGSGMPGAQGLSESDDEILEIFGFGNKFDPEQAYFQSNPKKEKLRRQIERHANDPNTTEEELEAGRDHHTKLKTEAQRNRKNYEDQREHGSVIVSHDWAAEQYAKALKNRAKKREGTKMNESNMRPYTEVRGNSRIFGFINEVTGEKTEVRRFHNTMNHVQINEQFRNIQLMINEKVDHERDFAVHAHKHITDFLKKRGIPHTATTTRKTNGDEHHVIQVHGVMSGEHQRQLHKHMLNGGFNPTPSTADGNSGHTNWTHEDAQGQGVRGIVGVTHDHDLGIGGTRIEIGLGRPHPHTGYMASGGIHEAFLGFGREKDKTLKQLKDEHRKTKRALDAAKREKENAEHEHERHFPQGFIEDVPVYGGREKIGTRPTLRTSIVNHRRAQEDHAAAKKALKDYRVK